MATHVGRLADDKMKAKGTRRRFLNYCSLQNGRHAALWWMSNDRQWTSEGTNVCTTKFVSVIGLQTSNSGILLGVSGSRCNCKHVCDDCMEMS